MFPGTDLPIYHVVLIGIDRYPRGYNSLSGCVNDIDAIENLLLTPPGIGIPPEQIKITRLAAPLPRARSTSRFTAQTEAPTKANVVKALQALAGPIVKQNDRVLICYSGHGDEKLWTGSQVWHEAIIPNDERNVEYLFDVEINGLIRAIAQKTSDLTIILDSCHSAGATRALDGIQAKGAVRALKGDDKPVAPPDLAALGLDSGTAASRALGTGMLQSSDPDYLVVVACQSDEKASEGAYPPNQPPHGVLTHSLLNVLGGKNTAERVQMRWADIWSELLVKAAERNTQLRQRTQHPWLIGRSERKVFGGQWEKMDLGYRVTQRQDGSYEVGAGSLMSVTEGAEIAVYGSQPLLFPTIGSPGDQPVGHLKVSQAGPSSAVAALDGEPFVLPEGARGRLVKPGDSQRLRVCLKPEDAALAAQLQESALLKIVPSTDPDADVEVIAQPDGGWILGNETEILLARVPAGEKLALRAGLEHCYRYNTVLRMARNCKDPQLSNSLRLKVLDCNDTAALDVMTNVQKADPALAEAPRDKDQIYSLNSGFKFCCKVTNNSSYHLNVTLFDCSSGGMVQYLSDGVVRDGAALVMWLDNDLGSPFEANPDEMPAGGPMAGLPGFVTDRLIAIGTTRPDADLRGLTVDKTVQQIVEENLSFKRGIERGGRPGPASAAPVELWTATVTPIRISR